MTGLSKSQNFFNETDKAIIKISPRNDVMLLRVLTAVFSIICFAVDFFVYLPSVYWIGVVFYIFCLFLYFEGLLKSLILLHKVSAELLIVTVMIVTLIDGKPLSGALVAWFIGLGLYISFTIIRKNREKIEALLKEGKKTARVIYGNEVKEVPIKAVLKGDLVIVPKGEMIPVDSAIIEGKSFIDESSVTGEPFPIYKKAGDELISGTINLSAPIQVIALKRGDDSFISVITDEIERSLQNKSELQKRADKTVQVLLLSVIGYSFLLYIVTGNLNLMATALSIVCPCAWALATPTAFASTIGHLARLNILVRGGEPLENIKDARTLVLDKTGTVTLAEPEVKEVIPIKMQKKELLEIVASVESRFNHPIADSILNFAKGQGITNFKNVKETEDIPGRGIKAIVEEKEVIIGSPETLESLGIALPDVEYKGRAIWIAVDRDLKGIIVIQDIMHSEMKDLAEKIRSYGIKKVILATGDNEANEAKRVAEIVGADEYYFSCKPADKTALVKKRQSEGKVIMIGDGVNDAPSLAAANVGIAMGGHKNVNLAIKSSDIVVLGDDAKHVLKIFKLSKKMGRIINQNYTWAISFNIAGLALATLGFLNPILAAFLHHISSVFVVANAARLYIGKNSKF